MKQLAKILSISLTCFMLFGCAHPISMNPDLASVQAKDITPINKKVGYYISDASRALELTTGGGGGDKVRYFPYRDIEPGLYKALAEVFTGVAKIKNPQDAGDLSRNDISLVILPQISTASSSPSPFTWPPTQFTVTLACTVTDPAGRAVHNLSVTGNGSAEFDEFKTNFSLAAVRATNDALSRLIKALGEAPELRK